MKSFIISERDKGVFSPEEIELLVKHGKFYQDLCCGQRKPKTKAQKDFISAYENTIDPRNKHQRVWFKYTTRCEWNEKDGTRKKWEDYYDEQLTSEVIKSYEIDKIPRKKYNPIIQSKVKEQNSDNEKVASKASNLNSLDDVFKKEENKKYLKEIEKCKFGIHVEFGVGKVFIINIYDGWLIIDFLSAKKFDYPITVNKAIKTFKPLGKDAKSLLIERDIAKYGFGGVSKPIIYIDKADQRKVIKCRYCKEEIWEYILIIHKENCEYRDGFGGVDPEAPTPQAPTPQAPILPSPGATEDWREQD